jgi:hypothetical protein
MRIVTSKTWTRESLATPPESGNFSSSIRGYALPWYNGELLALAHDLGLSAFAPSETFLQVYPRIGNPSLRGESRQQPPSQVGTAFRSPLGYSARKRQLFLVDPWLRLAVVQRRAPRPQGSILGYWLYRPEGNETTYEASHHADRDFKDLDVTSWLLRQKAATFPRRSVVTPCRGTTASSSPSRNPHPRYKSRHSHPFRFCPLGDLSASVSAHRESQSQPAHVANRHQFDFFLWRRNPS